MGRLQQLKERRIVQIVISYLAVGWIAMEVVGEFVERDRLPPLAWDVALLWFVAGLGAALLIGWYHGERGKQKAPLSEIAAIALIGVGALSLSSWTVYGHVARASAVAAAQESALRLKRIAVLYFGDLSRDGSARFLADGVTEGLIDELAAVRELDVVSRAGVAPFRGEDDVELAGVSERLRAGTLITGQVEPRGDGYGVALQVVDGSGLVFRRAAFDLPASELNRASARVVEEAAALLREWVGEEFRLRRTRAETPVVEAWALFHRGEEARKRAAAAAAAGDRASALTAFERADSLLALAAVADPAWVEPPLARAHLAFRRSRTAGSREELMEWIERGLQRAEIALAMAPNDARAVEVRGTLRYWRWLQGTIPDPDAAQALFDAARADLERAVELDPSLASAYASLTHVYLNVPSHTDALLAGQRAYEEDEFLENAAVVVRRNFDASYVLERFTEARRWCDIGTSRFPGEFRFTLCRLLLMTTRTEEPDPELAWDLLARIDSLAPAHQAEWEGLRARMLVGGVLARAGLPDSARAVWLRTRRQVDPEVDPGYDIPFVEAYMRTLAGDDDEAIDLLKGVAAALPGVDFETNWWWRDLRAHPRWSELRRSP